MRKKLYQREHNTLAEDKLTVKKLEFNHRKNKEQDHTELLDSSAKNFNYQDCKGEYWNPEKFSLLYGTPLWDQASASERVLLNQIYWVAYYAQIISAEIATIFFNQTAAAGLFGLEDFRLVCETLDFESMQERAHIDAFKVIGEQFEEEVFGERIFTYPMRPYFYETMIFQKTNMIKKFWKSIQLRSYSLLSSGNAFIGCQYLTVRGLRTLNGKIVQHQLSKYYTDHEDKENAPIPSKVSYYHFMDESYHFNSSNIIGSDIIKNLKKPTAFESFIANLGIKGTLKDHSNFNISVNGIFWYEPAIFETLLKLLTTKVFGMSEKDAIHILKECFTKENQGIVEAFETHQTALESYRNYLSNIEYVSKSNKNGGSMNKTSIENYLTENRRQFFEFERKKNVA
ncbi:P-aminobenzoate N-oxygenase AurF [Halobacteriovorax marinus]|uniref:P-aminobenzoate N-oxygenase AurF n=1 Tax=Halobacteriovorax marinus TaxID=97084 RepID=UPI000BC2FC1D|nr:P-aminobenzoate N-oxygenase AurF [Halobacteriovorax marinus]ATH07975.1 P-aminobenzoate N-oxygenase AurF [Halobacteriovorax marinus]